MGSETERREGVEVIREPEAARMMLKPIRRRILEELSTPDSAAGLARRLDLPRQRLNHHLRELERVGLLDLVEERRRGNCMERVLQATARSYVISPEALGAVGELDEDRLQDRFSWAYLVGIAGRAIRDLGILRRRADAAGKQLQTMTLTAEVRLASAAALERFTEELSNGIARVVAKHHDERSDGGRSFEFFVGAYPKLDEKSRDSDSDSKPN